MHPGVTEIHPVVTEAHPIGVEAHPVVTEAQQDLTVNIARRGDGPALRDGDDLFYLFLICRLWIVIR